MWRRIGSVVLLLVSVLPAVAQNTTIESFSKAKKLAASVYAGHEQTFYCGCTYSEKTVDFASCGYTPKGKPETAKRLEWEMWFPRKTLDGLSLNGATDILSVSLTRASRSREELRPQNGKGVPLHGSRSL